MVRPGSDAGISELVALLTLVALAVLLLVAVPFLA